MRFLGVSEHSEHVFIKISRKKKFTITKRPLRKNKKVKDFFLSQEPLANEDFRGSTLSAAAESEKEARKSSKKKEEETHEIEIKTRLCGSSHGRECSAGNEKHFIRRASLVPAR